jgi:hypothetical protein
MIFIPLIQNNQVELFRVIRLNHSLKPPVNRVGPSKRRQSVVSLLKMVFLGRVFQWHPEILHINELYNGR